MWNACDTAVLISLENLLGINFWKSCLNCFWNSSTFFFSEISPEFLSHSFQIFLLEIPWKIFHGLPDKLLRGFFRKKHPWIASEILPSIPSQNQKFWISFEISQKILGGTASRNSFESPSGVYKEFLWKLNEFLRDFFRNVSNDC